MVYEKATEPYFASTETRSYISGTIAATNLIASDGNSTSFTNFGAGGKEGRTNLLDQDLNTKMCAIATWINRDKATFSMVFNSETNSSQRLRYRLGEYSLGSANDNAARDPSSWTLYGSNDGKQWTAIETVTDFSFPDTRKALYNFPVEVSVPYSQYRLDVHKTKADTESFQLSELSFWAAETYGEIGAGATLSTYLNGNPHTSFGKNETPDKLQDNNTGTKMCATNANINTGNNTFSLVWELELPDVLQMYSMTTANDGVVRDPISWRVLGSDDGVEWTELDYIANALDLMPTERFTQVDFLLDNEEAFAFYRFDFLQTRSNDPAFQLSEMSLWAPRVPEPSTCVLLFLGMVGMVYYTSKGKKKH
ncbi:MAG: PEP-CTERM sorting domain-containing protein [Planctomycetia bacterium]|nr:PEP-CTERM sorting domain-containing protein [Planctomycetia bacterium]